MDSLDDDVQSLTALLHGINVHPPSVAGGGGTDQDVSQPEPLIMPEAASESSRQRSGPFREDGPFRQRRCPLTTSIIRR